MTQGSTATRTAERRSPPWMDDELEAVADLARNFFAKHVTPHQKRFASQGFPDKSAYRELGGALGLAGMSIPHRVRRRRRNFRARRRAVPRAGHGG